uniref:Uncharacterized protein n=1 Tax=Caenorhabditis japonica TaxID=281687 RepID=A0A8R1ISS2_CAEJA
MSKYDKQCQKTNGKQVFIDHDRPLIIQWLTAQQNPLNVQESSIIEISDLSGDEFPILVFLEFVTYLNPIENVKGLFAQAVYRHVPSDAEVWRT